MANAALCMMILCWSTQLTSAGWGCPTGDSSALSSHNNSVYNETTNSGVPTAGPMFPTLSSRTMREYGIVGSCGVSSAAEGFDGGEIVVGATIPMHGEKVSYGKVMRHTIEIFLEWLNLERRIPNYQNVTGGLMVGGKRYSMRFAWIDDGQEPSKAAVSIAYSTRSENASFGWAGYGSVMSRLQAEQTELDGVLLMAAAAANPDVFAGRELTFGALPPDITYLTNALRAVAHAAANRGIMSAELKLGVVYHPHLRTMCARVAEQAEALGITVIVAPRSWRTVASEQPLESNATDERVDTVLRELRADGVNFVVGCVYVGGGMAVMEGMERVDYAPHAVALTSTVDISNYQARVGNGWWQGEYALGVSPWHSSLTHRGNFSGMDSAEFLQRYHTRYSETPSYHGPASFAVVCALAAAIEGAGSVNPRDVAARLRGLKLQEFGFYSPIDFSQAGGQNVPEMLVVQFPPGGTDLKIVYPERVPSTSVGIIQFPMPLWGKRRCSKLGPGVKYGDQLPLVARPTSECFGHGTCVVDYADVVSRDKHEVYKCKCDVDTFGEWSGKSCEVYMKLSNHNTGIPGWIIALVVVCGLALVGVSLKYWRSTKSKRQQLDEMSQKMAAMADCDDELADVTKQLEHAQEKQKKLLQKRMAMQDVPDTWSTATETLVELLPDDEQYWTVSDKLRSTMDDACISKLWRVQNLPLWNFYSFHKNRLATTGANENERAVWHGTSSLDPGMIYNDVQDGFMMQFSSVGFWGKGIYFADKASYSNNYAYNPRTSCPPERPDGKGDEKEMFLAKLLRGTETMMNRDESGRKAQECKDLICPPIDPCEQPLFRGSLQSRHCSQLNPQPWLVAATNIKFNTVTGNTAGSQVWIVYENGRAYPDYLVRYYRGTRDPARTPFENRVDAGAVTRTSVPMTMPNPLLTGVQWTCLCVDDGTPGKQLEVPYEAALNKKFEAEYSQKQPAAKIDFTGYKTMPYTADVLGMQQEHRETGTKRPMRRYVDGQLSQWTAVYDEGSQHYYFCNRETNETVWQPNPLCPVVPPLPPPPPPPLRV